MTNLTEELAARVKQLEAERDRLAKALAVARDWLEQLLAAVEVRVDRANQEIAAAITTTWPNQ